MLLNPQILRRLEVVSKDRDDLLDLVIAISIDKEVDWQRLFRSFGLDARSTAHIQL